MKTTLITLSLLLALQFVFAQEWGGPFHPNPNAVPCLTETDYKFYHERVSENIAKLERSGKLQQFKPNTIVNFIWPVQAAPGTQYNSVWSISNYVDHDSASNSLSDYNCGTRTYDTSSGYDHQGVDIFTWPFWWKQMEDDAAQIVAAAPGQIIYKNDGSGDRNCSFNNDLWNAVYVQHSDGSVAWYGHMKENSLTGKNVGDTVSQGEVLGIVGSSGNSTGPHLHFEVYDNGPNLIDPYAGPCNTLNTESWWATQRPYINPGINAVLTHTALPDFGSCPETEITFEENQFAPGDTVYLGSYFKDQQPGTTAVNTVYDPNGNVHTSWNRNFTQFYYASWWVSNTVVSSVEGDWVYEVAYNGETVSHVFTVGALGTAENNPLGLKAFPNPATDKITIEAAQPLETIVVYDVLGKLLDRISLNGAFSKTINLSGYGPGVYFLKVANGSASGTVSFVKR